MDRSSNSDPKTTKWVAEISERLTRQLEIQVEIPPVSIFLVQETITKTKPNAYKPQQIGFGPYHHFRHGPHTKTEQKKLMLLQRVLKDRKIKDFGLTVVDRVKKCVHVIRACYDMFLQDDDDSLAWVLAIDGLFLLDLFTTYDRKQLEADSTNKRLLVQDIMMVENQIPYMVLKEIQEALNSSPGTNTIPSEDEMSTCNNFSPTIFRSLCEIHTPLELCSDSQAPTHEHLLHYMYHSIINNVRLKPLPSCTESITNISTNKITIPSASKLRVRARFGFHDLLKDEGIDDIYMDKNIIYLPIITWSNNSEVILRNLVAYETLIPGSSRGPLNEYMGLMCGLVVNTDDVKLLREENIIRGDLADDEVVKIFVGMSSSIKSMNTNEKSKLQDMIDKVNKVYESNPRIKASLFLNKHCGSFVGGTLKIVAYMISIVTMFMLSYQAYCDIYGGDKKSVTLLSYASS
ncbi:putative UPF0481 protein At3g02645 [Bidens hawaiensis]|uniref:putative UPF0481 protein At3g02645 n=1 Tax=Bidens hawaiensis TaxID=980011 RepID=UPI00404A2AA3